MNRGRLVVFACVVLIGTQFLPAGATHRNSVAPILDCVELSEREGFQWLTAYLGYFSTHSTTVKIPVGDLNYFFPGAANRSQPTTFAPGMHDRVFAASWQVNTFPRMEWNIDGHPVRITPDSVKCGADKISWHGAWNAEVMYYANDAVKHNGSSWLAVRQNEGVVPVEGADWNLMAARGDSGPAASGGFTPVVPVRLADTRQTEGPPRNPLNVYNVGPLAPGETRTISVAGPVGPSGGQQTLVPSHATGATFNVAVTNTEGPGYLTIFPADVEKPYTSNINWMPGQTTSNQTTVKLNTSATGSSGQIKVFNGSDGRVDVVLDLNGFYT